MTKNISLGLFLISICTGCNPYLTKKLNLISKENKKDSVYVVDPIIETRLQISPNSHTSDEETFQPAKKLSREVLHELLDSHLRLKYALVDSINSSEFENLMDSVSDKFLGAEYARFSINKEFKIPSTANLILIPYLKWTRTTPEFESYKCGLDGKIYAMNSVCTWSQARAYVFLIDRKRNELVYFRYNQWDKEDIWIPYKKRILRSFRHCAQSLLRKLG